jgi:hypothetical protein
LATTLVELQLDETSEGDTEPFITNPALAGLMMTLRFGTDTGRFSGRATLSGAVKPSKNRNPVLSSRQRGQETAGFV